MGWVVDVWKAGTARARAPMAPSPPRTCLLHAPALYPSTLTPPPQAPRPVLPQVRGILRSFVSRLRVSARTAYIALSRGSAHAAGAADQGRILSALAIGVSAGLQSLDVNLDKLANHVAEASGQVRP